MPQKKLPAVFMRGGTSKAVIFHARDLPASRAEWDPIFLSVIGSPDPSMRQLNGMGGGVSSLSKVCVIGPPSHPDADVDYTFAQVLIDKARVDYNSNCGNMSSAIGPFAVDEGLVAKAARRRRRRAHPQHQHQEDHRLALRHGRRRGRGRRRHGARRRGGYRRADPARVHAARRRQDRQAAAHGQGRGHAGRAGRAVACPPA